MNYTFDLPEKLKTVSKPKFKIEDEKLIIYNRPFFDDWFFVSLPFFAIIYMTLHDKLPLNNEYIILFIVLLFVAIFYSFSLNKVVFDFKEEKISIKNYNPILNLVRQILQMPFLISFKEIEKIYADWKLGGKNSTNTYFTMLQTDAPYKFRIAIFKRESQSIIFTDYLNKIIKHHSIHADAVSDTTVLN